MALAWVKKVLHCGAPPSPVIESTTDALDDPSSRAARKKERRSLTISRIIALLMVAGLCAVWVSQAEVSKGLQGGTYNHPYFMAYVAHGMYIAFFLFFIICRLCLRQWSLRGLSLFPPLKPFIIAGAVHGVTAFFLIYFWYLSLDKTILAANTAVYQSACIFVYFFSIIILKERLDWRKVLAVACCVLGVALVSYFSSTEANQAGSTWVGYVLLVVSTILYAFYEVMYTKLWPPEPLNNKWVQLSHSMLILGFMGVFTLVLLWPGIIIVHYAGIEPFALPASSTEWGILLSLGAFESAYNLLLFFGIVLTSPLFMAVGTTLAIPTAIVSDLVIHDIVLPAAAYASMSAIVVGFVAMAVLEAMDRKTHASGANDSNVDANNDLEAAELEKKKKKKGSKSKSKASKVVNAASGDEEAQAQTTSPRDPKDIAKAWASQRSAADVGSGTSLISSPAGSGVALIPCAFCSFSRMSLCRFCWFV